MQDWSRTCRRPAIYTENLRHKVVGMQKSVDEKRKIINKNKREYNVSPKESIRQQNGRNKHVSQIESRHAYQKNGEMSTTARGATQARSTWTEESLELKKERENVLSVSQRLLQVCCSTQSRNLSTTDPIIFVVVRKAAQGARISLER